MTHTVVSSATKDVIIGFDQPFVIIGERINPTGRKLLAAEMAEGDYSRVESDALAQIAAGAQMLDVNAGIPLADEPTNLGRMRAACARPDRCAFVHRQFHRRSPGSRAIGLSRQGPGQLSHRRRGALEKSYCR